jgi:RimJ/RimL family protein N-acetyltransferase
MNPAQEDVTNDLRLRPPRLDDIGWLAAMSADPEAVGRHNWSGVERDVEEIAIELQASIESDGAGAPLSGRLIVEIADTTPIGDVSWRPERWGPSRLSACPAFGIGLLPEFRGRGFGTEAQRLLITHLFATTDCNRVQSDTAVDNPAEQRVLEKLGMRREGVIRGAEYRDESFHDHVVYGVLRDEWPAATR